MDFAGIAYLVGAVVAAVPIVGGFVLQVLDRMDKKRRDERLEVIEKHVNGLTERAVAMGVRAGTAEGHALGVSDERALGGPGDNRAPIPVKVVTDTPIPVVESGKPA